MKEPGIGGSVQYALQNGPAIIHVLVKQKSGISLSFILFATVYSALR